MIIIIKKWIEDNEYYEVQYDTESNKYFSCFKDGLKKKHKIEIKKDIADVYLDTSKILKKMEHEYERHIEHSEIYENNLNSRAMDKPLSLEDEFIRQSTFEDVRNAIEQLPELQKRRIKLYYFNEMKQKDIADRENVDIRNVQHSLNKGVKKLYEILKNQI